MCLDPFLRTFDGLASLGDYVQRLVDAVAGPQRVPAPTYESSLGLPEAIDYLNAIWRVSMGEGAPLFRISHAEAAAKLALDCTTVGEFESRLSAVVGILSQIQLPGHEGDKSLMDLQGFLSERLDAPAADRVEEGIGALRAVVALRNWRQHTGVDSKGLAAVPSLGVNLASGDWASAWDVVRGRLVDALAVIREEVG